MAGARAGQQPAAPVPRTGYGDGRVRRHLQVLAGLWTAYGVLRVVSLAWFAIFGRVILPSIFGAGRSGYWPSAWQTGSWFFPFGLWFGGVSILFFGAAYLILGWALYQRKSWARIFGLVLGFLVLLRIPFGTALGIFTIWVLLPESSRQEYDAMAGAGS